MSRKTMDLYMKESEKQTPMPTANAGALWWVPVPSPPCRNGGRRGQHWLARSVEAGEADGGKHGWWGQAMLVGAGEANGGHKPPGQIPRPQRSRDAPKYTPELFSSTLPSTPLSCSQVRSQLDSMVHSQPTRLYAPKYTLKRDDTSNLTWLYAPMDASACSVEWLAELHTPGTRRGEAGVIWRAVFGGRRVACGIWHVAGGRWQEPYTGRNHDIIWYGSLYHILSAASIGRSHDASRSWYWQLQPQILRER